MLCQPGFCQSGEPGLGAVADMADTCLQRTTGGDAQPCSKDPCLTVAPSPASQVGTPCYAAPELFQFQPYGCACDVWSLGCILHELASLQLAFQAESIRQLRAKASGALRAAHAVVGLLGKVAMPLRRAPSRQPLFLRTKEVWSNAPAPTASPA